MADLIVQQLPFLEMLNTNFTKKEQTEALLATATVRQIKVLRDLLLNVSMRNINPTRKYQNKLKKLDKVIRQILYHSGKNEEMIDILLDNSNLIVSFIKKVFPGIKQHKEVKKRILKKLNG